jgi:hypothetical protein
VEVESVSKQARLFAVDLGVKFYTAWLVASAPSREALESRLKAGFEPNGLGVAMLLQLEKEGRAKRFSGQSQLECKNTGHGRA